MCIYMKIHKNIIYIDITVVLSYNLITQKDEWKLQNMVLMYVDSLEEWKSRTH